MSQLDIARLNILNNLLGNSWNFNLIVTRD
jgi:hypothetical protein